MSVHLSDRTLQRSSWALVCFVAVSYVAVGIVESLDGGAVTNWLPQVATLLTFPVVGLLITRRQPRNVIGWLMHATGFVWALLSLEDVYVRIAFHLAPGALPWAGQVEAVGTTLW